MASFDPAIPSVGRIVHLADVNGKCLAAIITAVCEDGKVCLTAFFPGTESATVCGSVCAMASYSEARVAQTWHWPERVQ